MFIETIREITTEMRILRNMKKGTRRYAEGEPEEAVKNFDAAIRLQNYNFDAYIFRGLVKCEMGHHADAILDFEEAKRLFPGRWRSFSHSFFPAYCGLLGVALCVQNNHDAAIENLDCVINNQPDCGMAIYYTRAITKSALGQYVSAIEDLDIVLRFKPECAAAYYSRAIARNKLGQFSVAIEDFRSALSNRHKWEIPPPFGAPGHVSAGDRLFRLCSPLMQFSEEHVRDCLGDAWVKLGEHYDATFSFQAAIRLNPDKAKTHSKLGWAYLELGFLVRAKSAFDEAIRLEPNYAHAYAGRGMARVGLWQYAAAVPDLRYAITKIPNYAEAHVALRETCDILWRVVAASYCFDQAIHENPDNAKTYYNRARFNQRVFPSRIQYVIADYDKALCLDPDYSEAYYYRGKARVQLEDITSAKLDIDEALRRNLENADAYTVRNLIDKLVEYNEAIALNPDDAANYYNRAIIKSKLGQYAAAVVDFDEVIQRNPDDIDTYYGRGGANINESCINLDRRERLVEAAIVDYSSVIELNPDSAEAHYYRGKGRVKLRDYAAAITDFDAAIRLSPDVAEYYSDRGHARYMLMQNNLLPLDDPLSDFTEAIRLSANQTDAGRARSGLCSGQEFCEREQYVHAIPILDIAMEFAQRLGNTLVKENISAELAGAHMNVSKILEDHQGFIARYKLVGFTYWQRYEVGDAYQPCLETIDLADENMDDFIKQLFRY